ncbi:MAG TPA: VCBS repeat-containing protein [Thermoanaerobaculia bacterium]|nr:VCBS repeat-containing protein [Thermoanaerobaculia bacterium]
MILLLAALLSFQPFDSGLPRSGQWRNGFAVADMNGDGLPDLAFGCARKRPGPPVIFLNERNGQWRRWEEAQFPPLPFDYGAVAAADFDGNGSNDLAVASHFTGVTVVLGDGRGTFVPASQEGLIFRPPDAPEGPAPFTSRAVVALDWNRDGLADVAAMSEGPRGLLGVTVYENLGNAWRPVRAAAPEYVFGDVIAAGDVDGDGLPDLLTASQVTNYPRVLRFSSNPDGRLAPRQPETSLPVYLVHSAGLHDFGVDGRDELLIGYTSATSPRRAVLELLSFPAGAAPPRELWSDEGNGRIMALAAGDVNGDGSADVVAGLSDGRLLTFRGDGRAFVTRDADIPVPEWRRGCNAYTVRLADLDGDGRDEVIAGFAGESNGCTSGGGIEVWKASDLPEPPRSPRRRSARH